jgi:hypothetical protein
MASGSPACHDCKRLGYHDRPSCSHFLARRKCACAQCCFVVPGQEAGGVALWPLVFATVASCLLEAATTQLDNIFLPLHHLAMLAA